MNTTLYLDVPTIGITGSFGKTTTKEITAALLSVKYDIFKSRRNFNTVRSTRRHVKQITDEHEAVVMEMTMGNKETGKNQCTLIQPNIGVITAVGHAHFENFTSIHETVLSKSEMMKYMDPNGTLYLNYDDEYSQLIDTKYFTGNIVQCGVSEGADYRATDIKFNQGGMEFYVRLNGVSEYMFSPILGEHNVINALFGIAIADKLGLTADEIREGLNTVKVQRGRLTLDRLEGNRSLLDDSGNANPVAMIAGLKVLNDYLESPRKVALLGDMAELGSYTREGHEKVGKALTDFNFDKVYLYGENSRWILYKAIETGFPEEKLIHFYDMELLIEEVTKNFEKDTALMLKASKSTKFQKVAKHLLAEYRIIE